MNITVLLHKFRDNVRLWKINYILLIQPQNKKDNFLDLLVNALKNKFSVQCQKNGNLLSTFKNHVYQVVQHSDGYISFLLQYSSPGPKGEKLKRFLINFDSKRAFLSIPLNGAHYNTYQFTDNRFKKGSYTTTPCTCFPSVFFKTINFKRQNSSSFTRKWLEEVEKCFDDSLRSS